MTGTIMVTRMVRSITQGRGLPMPGFFGYMGWSMALMALLMPCFALVTLLLFL